MKIITFRTDPHLRLIEQIKAQELIEDLLWCLTIEEPFSELRSQIGSLDVTGAFNGFSEIFELTEANGTLGLIITY